MNEEQHRKVRNIIRWQRIGCIVVKISENLDVSLKEALDMFYRSETCRRFHDEETGLYLQGNLYVLNDFLVEISAWFRAGDNLSPSPIAIDQVQKHTETALDTLKKEGTRGSFPVKTHSVPDKNLAIHQTSVVHKTKENRKSLKVKDLRFNGYPKPRYCCLLRSKLTELRENEGFWTGWYSMLATNWIVESYGQFAKNALSCDAIWWPKVTNAKSLRENEGYCLLVISGRYQEIISLIELRALKKCIQIDFSEYTLFNK